MSPAFLLALQLVGRRVVVVGTADEALLRCRDLRVHGALVRLVAPTADAALAEYARAEPDVEWLVEQPSLAHLDGAWLCVVADRNDAWVELLGPACLERQLFFCAVDQPRHNSFSHVGVASAGPLRVGISTSGVAPGLARWLRARLQELFDRADFTGIVTRLAGARAAASAESRRGVVDAELAKLHFEATLTRDP
ncbi:MAG TPA: NAD(P)-dependent oxidoreductase [Polyangiaceae bacterium]|nr:NAD(P)-dependent oxidoreductase [Polyangiaceae bacterium]